MDKQFELFCNAHGIPVDLKRPWYMPKSSFRKAQKKYYLKLSELYDAYTIMNDMYRNYYTLYQKTVQSFKGFHASIKLYELPEIDYTDIEKALQEIKWNISLLQFGKYGGAYDKLLRDQEEALFDCRHRYVQEVISHLPKDKHVVIVTTGKSLYANQKKEFNLGAIDLSKEPSNQIVAIYFGEFYEWIAFCPRQMNYYDLYKVFDLWKGDPRCAETRYL